MEPQRWNPGSLEPARVNFHILYHIIVYIYTHIISNMFCLNTRWEAYQVCLLLRDVMPIRDPQKSWWTFCWMKSDWFVVKTKQPWENDDFYGKQWTINVYADLYISMMNVMLYMNYRFLWWILVGYVWFPSYSILHGQSICCSPLILFSFSENPQFVKFIHRNQFPTIFVISAKSKTLVKCKKVSHFYGLNPHQIPLWPWHIMVFWGVQEWRLEGRAGDIFFFGAPRDVVSDVVDLEELW